MKKILTLLMLATTLISCSAPTVKYSDKDQLQEFKVTKVYENQYEKIAIVNFEDETGNSKKIKPDRPITIAESEFSTAGFNVLERRNFKLITNEHLFADNVAIARLRDMFPAANEVVSIKLTKNTKWDYIDFYLLYNKYVAVQEVRVDIKLINTSTGEIRSTFGEGQTKVSASTVLFFGTYQSKSDELFEESLRIAIRNAIKKLN